MPCQLPQRGSINQTGHVPVNHASALEQLYKKRRMSDCCLSRDPAVLVVCRRRSPDTFADEASARRDVHFHKFSIQLRFQQTLE